MCCWQLFLVYIMLHIASKGTQGRHRHTSVLNVNASTIANEAPIYLSDGAVIMDKDTCGRTVTENYAYVVFEGYVNLAQLLSHERNSWTMALILFSPGIQSIMCKLLYRSSQSPPCRILEMDIVNCSCQSVQDMLVRATFDLQYNDFFMDGTFSLSWIGPDPSLKSMYHTLTSQQRILPLAHFGSYSLECSEYPRDSMPRRQAVSTHTVADDPPVYMSAFQIIMAPNSTDPSDEQRYQMIVFEGYVNMAKVPLDERPLGAVRFICERSISIESELIFKIDNATAQKPDIKTKDGTTCSVGNSLQDLKLRVFAEIEYLREYKDCPFYLHWIAPHTLSSHARYLPTPHYVTPFDILAMIKETTSSKTTAENVAHLAIYSCTAKLTGTSSPSEPQQTQLEYYKNVILTLQNQTKQFIEAFKTWNAFTNSKPPFDDYARGMFNIPYTESTSCGAKINYRVYAITQLSIYAYYLSTQEQDSKTYGVAVSSMASFVNQLTQASCSVLQWLGSTVCNEPLADIIVGMYNKEAPSIQSTTVRRQIVFSFIKIISEKLDILKNETNRF